MIKFLDLHAQYLAIKPQIDSAIGAVISDSTFVGGAPVGQFESAFADYVGAAHCIGVANGTDALEIAIEALQLPPGSEIIVPGNTFIATSEAVTRTGHRVVFADVDPECYTLTAETVAACMSPRTAAIVAVHLYGHPCDMDPLLALARERNCRIIEDCAQAHGAAYRGRRVGTLGKVATFSFYPGKNLGAYGDAGAIVTDDEALAVLSRKIANHGRVAKYDHEIEGRNSRLDGIQAAILNAKLPFLEGWTRHRIAIADQYLGGLGGLSQVVLPVRRKWARQVYHLFVIRSAKRDALRACLADQEIETGIHYPIALPKLAAYRYLRQQDEPFFVNRVDSTLLSLPIGEHVSPDDADKVINAIRSFAR